MHTFLTIYSAHTHTSTFLYWCPIMHLLLVLEYVHVLQFPSNYFNVYLLWTSNQYTITNNRFFSMIFTVIHTMSCHVLSVCVIKCYSQYVYDEYMYIKIYCHVNAINILCSLYQCMSTMYICIQCNNSTHKIIFTVMSNLCLYLYMN